ncbi:MAG: type II toxin-antitoxin system RelE/ParE family toxin [Spirochaetales bacterium]|nr:type II toxin-antitoxin system RelE/ParE family toxin [Spirochaetales bacterium]
MIAQPIEILVYEDENGKEPFVEWLNSCNRNIRAKIFTRLDRVEQGNLGDNKFIENDVFELRIHFSPGYRIYFGKKENEIVILLTGGKKSTQKKDIAKAKKFWNEFNGRTK